MKCIINKIKQYYCKHQWLSKGGWTYMGVTLPPAMRRCVKCKKQELLKVDFQFNKIVRKINNL